VYFGCQYLLVYIIASRDCVHQANGKWQMATNINNVHHQE
jgi:hypothetical protein